VVASGVPRTGTPPPLLRQRPNDPAGSAKPRRRADFGAGLTMPGRSTETQIAKLVKDTIKVAESTDKRAEPALRCAQDYIHGCNPKAARWSEAMHDMRDHSPHGVRTFDAACCGRTSAVPDVDPRQAGGFGCNDAYDVGGRPRSLPRSRRRSRPLRRAGRQPGSGGGGHRRVSGSVHRRVQSRDSHAAARRADDIVHGARHAMADLLGRRCPRCRLRT
jgi:hypothetical protein